MSMSAVDVVTVVHRDENHALSVDLESTMRELEATPFTFIRVDNRARNVGFAAGCNAGAAAGSSAVVLFLNPDATVHGPFLDTIVDTLADPSVAVCGSRFDTPRADSDTWGCPQWVSGACCAVARAWWEKLGGFDEAFFWAWEESDLIRRAMQRGGRVVELDLPVRHSSPDQTLDPDRALKQHHFDRGARRFYARWGQPPAARRP